MTTGPGGVPPLDWTGERYVPQLSGNIRLEHVHRYLFARELSKGRRVLDIACGEGYGSDLLAAVAAHVTGVDIVPEVVQHASRRYRRRNLRFVAGNCAAIPLSDQCMDVVVSFETIEHHDQHQEMMREIRRILRPGGVLVISSPDRQEYSDLPGHENPFHVRELYREEFDELLTSHFRHVGVVGQRIRAGSIIGPVGTQGDASFVSFEHSDVIDRRTDGLRAPLYFIAVATDGSMPTLPTGLLDGGEFVWSSDHVQAVQGVRDQLGAQVNHLTQAQAIHDATTSVLKTELARQMAAITTLSEEKGRLADQVERSGRTIADLESVRTQLQTALDDTRVELRSTRAQLDTQAHATASREALVQRLEQREGHTQALENELRKKIDVLETSRSWRLTAPLRAARRSVGRAPAFARKITSDSVRSIYRNLPLPPATKLRLKDGLFRTLPFVVRHTVAYREWKEQARVGTDATPETSPPADAVPTGPAQAVFPAGLAEEAQPEHVPLTTTPGVDTQIKAIAFYLPQFHPIPENDRWWGKGFTEWHNVTRGRSQFAGHYQPHLPGELGFYDLRLLDVQRRQIELAKMYGLHGFCYHHYWFGGNRLLRQPLDQLLANADLDFPFCLCWANENWTRRWDGLEDEILIAQQHSPDDDVAFIQDIEPALRDPRYIRIDGRPLLIVYRPGLLPNAKETSARWRAHCRNRGLGDPFLISTHAFDRCNPHDFGFDAALEFAPNNMGAPKITAEVPLVNPEFRGDVYDYRYLVEYSRRYQRPADYLLFRSVAPMWDNEARRPGRGTVFAHASPSLFGEWLENACRHTVEHLRSDQPLVFVNAWNEWAEGAHLEPDRCYGYAYLQATADTLRKFPAMPGRPLIVVVSHDAYFHGAQRVALTLAQTLSARLGYSVEVLLCGPGPLTSEFAKAGRVHDFSDSSTAESRARIVRNLHSRGARIALCNTSCVGETVHLLKAAGFTVVSMIHELPDLIANYALESSVDRIARDADRVVFPARLVRDRFVDLTDLPAEKSVVRPQGLLAANRFEGRRSSARSELRARLGLQEHVKVVLAVGYADHRKGIDVFVDVGLRITKSRGDVACVWVGHHEETAFSQAYTRIVEAGAESQFFFPGLVEDSDVFFAGADVYLMTSREDPFPLVVLHALEAETPVIGFDGAGGFVELLERNCGILVPYLDVDAMATAAVRLLERPSEGHILTAAGKTIIDREFSFIDYARDLVQIATSTRTRVSVIVPSYNYAQYLPARVRSILMQTHTPHEIIFLDDCSSDNSVALAEQLLAASAIPFRIVRNDRNQGVYRQWLRGLREATGDLVWIAEADDDCAPTLLETLVPMFTDKSVVLAYCQSKQIDETGRELAPDYLEWTADISRTKWQQPYVRAGIDEIRDTLVVKNSIPNVSAVLMRKFQVADIEPQLKTLRNAGDWLLYIHLLERGALSYTPAPLNYHRRHSSSVTIGYGGLTLMQETLLVQRHVLDRHRILADVEHKRQAHLQTTYEFLALNADGPPLYQDHQALSGLTVLAR